MGLDKNGILLRIQTAGDISRDLGQGPFAQGRRVLAHGDGMQVGHEPVTVELIRQLRPVLDRTQIIAQMQLAAGLDAGEKDLFLVFHLKKHLLRVYRLENGPKDPC